MVKLHFCKQGSKEWHELRKNKITASNAHLLLEKGAAAALAANSKTFNGNYWTERGKTLEPEAIDIYQQVYGVDTLHVGFVTNDTLPNCGASPDGIAGDTLLEVKCFSEKRHGYLDFKVLAQVHFSMLICGLERAQILFYNPDLDIERGFIVKEIIKDDAIAQNIARKLQEAGA